MQGIGLVQRPVLREEEQIQLQNLIVALPARYMAGNRVRLLRLVKN